jgi:hypothetical protein
MSIVKTLGLSLAAVIILAAHSTPSFAEVSLSYGGVELSSTQGAGGAASDDGESLWDYICGLLW